MISVLAFLLAFFSLGIFAQQPLICSEASLSLEIRSSWSTSQDLTYYLYDVYLNATESVTSATATLFPNNNSISSAWNLAPFENTPDTYTLSYAQISAGQTYDSAGFISTNEDQQLILTSLNGETCGCENFITPDGYVYDINSLAANVDYFYYSAPYSYRFNFCHYVTSITQASYAYQNDGLQRLSLGGEMSFSVHPNGTDKGLVVTYSGGSNVACASSSAHRSSNFILTCSTYETTTTFEGPDAGDCVYLFEILSSFACPLLYTSTTGSSTTTGSPSGVCEVQFNADSVNSWSDSTQSYAQFSATITNNGTNTISSLEFSISSSDANRLQQFWNINLEAPKTYSPAAYGLPLAPGGTFSFGYIVSGTEEIIFTVISC